MACSTLSPIRTLLSIPGEAWSDLSSSVLLRRRSATRFCRSLSCAMVVAATGLSLASACFAQTATSEKPLAAKPVQQNGSAGKYSAANGTAPLQSQTPHSAQDPFAEISQKYPGLLPEFAQLTQKLQQNVSSPAPRTASRLLPLLPESTVFYLAMPNYGDAAQQSLAIFRQELQQSAVLRDWWTHGEMASDGQKVEKLVEQFDEFQRYLGDEIVLSASYDPGRDSGTFLAVAEIRKPGLEKFIPQWISLLTDNAVKPGVRVLTLSDLATTPDPKTGPGIPKELLVLVRPDFVVATTDWTALRSFNAHLLSGSHAFAASAFGQRLTQEYRSGVSALAGGDIQTILSKSPSNVAGSRQAFENSGFADMKYAVWKRVKVGTDSASQGELSFNGPRHGAAAWLGKPQPLGSLDFVSPKAVFALTLVLSSFSQIFDDIRQFGGPANANTFNAIDGGQKALNLDLKADLLSQLAGEFTVELDSVANPQNGVKVIFKVNDANHVRKTFNTLLAAAQMQPEHFEEGGIAYDAIRVPNQPPMTIAYAFVDGYLIMATSPQTLTEALRLHRSGGSLAKSQRYLASLPAGQSGDASGFFYQDPAASAGLAFRQISPELADMFRQFAKQAPPSVVRLYGEPSAIREASTSGSVDVGTALVAAAIAIPNLLRARVAANEATAVGSIRTVNTAEVAYSTTYPIRGFTTDLATLGPSPATPTRPSADHADLVDSSLANATCTADSWCAKSGYQFRVTSFCKQRPCREYVVVATPLDGNTGTKNFCSTSSGVIRYKPGAPLTSALTASQCNTWAPLQ